MIWLTLASKKPELMETTLYTLEISNNIGLMRKITFLGVDAITSTPEPINVSAAYEIFPWLPPCSVERPTREVSLLIGNDEVPTGGEPEFTNKNLRCMKSSFGTGWVLGGRHSRIQSRPQSCCSHVEDGRCLLKSSSGISHQRGQGCPAHLL